MKILRLCPLFTPTDKKLKGLSTHLTPLTLAQRKLGIKQEIITTHSKVKKYKDIKIHKIPTKRFTFLRNGFEAYKLTKEKKIEFDILHHHNPGFFTINYKKINKPVVFTIHNSIFRIIKNIKFNSFKSLKEDLYFYFFSKICLKNADAVITGSKEDKNDLINKLKLNRKKVHYIPAGYDEKIFYNNKKIKKENKILYVGRFVKSKGIPFLIKAFEEISKKNNKLKLYLIGGSKKDNDYDNIINLIKKLKGKIKVLTHISFKELAKQYNSTKLLIAPSITEGTAKVGIECLACGTPIIASNVGGFRDYVINGKTGYRIKVGDYKSIIKYTLKLLNNKKLLNKMSKNCSVLAKRNFTWKSNAEKHRKLYTKLLKRQIYIKK